MNRNYKNKFFNHHPGSNISFTEILVVVIIAGILISIGIPAFLNYNTTAYQNAMESLNAFSEEYNLKPGSCQRIDTNNNHYITCTAQNDQGQILTLECSTGWMGNSGCFPKAMIPYQ